MAPKSVKQNEKAETMRNIISLIFSCAIIAGCNSKQATLDETYSTPKTKLELCLENVEKIANEREAEIRQIVRLKTLSGGRQGSGGIGKASAEAKIWAYDKQQELSEFLRNEKKLCHELKTQ